MWLSIENSPAMQIFKFIIATVDHCNNSTYHFYPFEQYRINFKFYFYSFDIEVLNIICRVAIIPENRQLLIALILDLVI